MTLEALMLYRNILKIHRTMPKEMKDLGNRYIREEFKRHLYPKIENFSKAHYITFVESWQNYLSDLKNPEVRLYGRRLSPEELNAMSTSQKKTLNEFQEKFLKN